MNITYFRVFLGILGHYSIQYLNFAKKWFNSLFNSKISRKFNSKKYSIQKFARKFNSKKYSIKKIQFKKIFNSKICKKIQFKIWFKMLNLAGFNSTIYSFNNKTWVSLTPSYNCPLFLFLFLRTAAHWSWQPKDACQCFFRN